MSSLMRRCLHRCDQSIADLWHRLNDIGLPRTVAKCLTNFEYASGQGGIADLHMPPNSLDQTVLTHNFIVIVRENRQCPHYLWFEMQGLPVAADTAARYLNQPPIEVEILVSHSPCPQRNPK